MGDLARERELRGESMSYSIEVSCRYTDRKKTIVIKN